MRGETPQGSSFDCSKVKAIDLDMRCKDAKV